MPETEFTLLQAALWETGALLLRGADSLDAFIGVTELWGQAFRQVMPDKPLQALLGSQLKRQPLSGYDSVFLATGPAEHYALPLHGELYFQGAPPPQLLCFYCARPAKIGGDTLLCDGRALFAQLPVEIQQFFLEHALVYLRIQSEAQWQQAYQTQDFAALQDFLNQQQTQALLTAEGELETRYTCRQVIWYQQHWVFINNFLPFTWRELHEPAATRARLRMRNGQPVPAEIVKAVHTLAEQLTYPVRWQQGDILLIDNRRVMHGRKAIADPQRRLYLRMAGKLNGARA